MNRKKWLAVGLSILIAVTSTPTLALSALADTGTEQLTSSSGTTDEYEEASEAAGTADEASIDSEENEADSEEKNGTASDSSSTGDASTQTDATETAGDEAAAQKDTVETDVEDTSARDTTAEDSVDEDTATEETASKDTAAEDSVAEDTVSKDSVVGDTAAEDTIAEDTTTDDSVEADSTAEDDLVTLTFNANNGQRSYGDDEEATQTVWTESYSVGDTFSWELDEIPFRQSYAFLGWSKKQTATKATYKVDDSDAVVPSADTTLYAVWEEGVTITFDSNDGTDTRKAYFFETGGRFATYFENISGAIFERDGYLLTGFSVDKDATEPDYGYSAEEIYNSLVPDVDTTLYAVWKNQADITFDANGGQHYEGSDEDATATTWTNQYAAGGTFGGAETAYREGYVLKGWSTSQDSTTPEYVYDEMYEAAVPADGTTLYAVWEKGIEVTFDGNGGFVNGSSETYVETVETGSSVWLTSAVRYNYVLTGWEGSDGKIYSAFSSVYPSEDMTFTAIWSAECTIRLYANDGTSSGTLSSYTCAEGERFFIGDDAERDGYLFLGWSTDKNATTASVEQNSYIDVSGDVDLYAVWAPASSGYTVTLDMNGGTCDGADTCTEVVAKGNAIDGSEHYMIREGYVLEGWSLTKDGESVADNFTSYVPSTDVTLYAVWEKSYTITFKDGDSTRSCLTCCEDDYPGSIPSVMYVGSSREPITGWLDEDTEQIYSSGELLTTPVTDDHTYIAQSDADSICEVTLDKNDGSGDETVVDVAKGASVSKIFGQSGFYRKGYELLGWSEDSSADWTDPDTYYNSDNQPFAVTEDMTLYAVWGPLCSITFDANGGKMTADGENSVSTEKNFCGYESYSDIAESINNECTRTGYVFAGWSTDPDAGGADDGFTLRGSDSEKYLNITSDTTLYAVWKKGCTVTLDFNGGKVKDTPQTSLTCQVVSGQTISEATEDGKIVGTRDGYVLEGWSTDEDDGSPTITTAQFADYEPSDDEVWYAVWTPIKAGSTNTVFFCVNGGGITAASVLESLSYDSSGYWAAIPEGRSINDMLDQNGSDYGLGCIRNGYVLAGWSEKSDAESADFSTAEELGAFEPTEDVTLYAVWEPLELTLNTASVTLDKGRKYSLDLTSSPEYAWDGSGVVDNLSYESNDTDVAVVDSETGEITAKSEGMAVIRAFCGDQSVECLVTVQDGDQGILYKSHVQKKGTMDWVEDGAVSGTTGQKLRMEALYLTFADPDYLGSVEYRAYVQKIGWQGWSVNGAMAGTEGQALRMEAVQIRLTGEMAEQYDIYYCVHAQHFGWLNWAKNGESSGTAGYGYRLEAIRIRLVKKGDAAPSNLGTDTAAYHKNTASVTYRSHVQTYGNLNWVSDGALSGTKGESKRMEAVYIKLASQPYTGDIEYQSYIQTYGWEDSWVKNGSKSGTSGRAKRLEAIRIRLTGEMAEQYDVYYRVYAQRFGWLGWAKNGASAGTAGYGYRLEGIEVKLVPKGQAAPGSTENTFRQKK
ncbi:MAG: InlB B-repeat-containing protein [Eubacteriales bacterium]|jgi:uncharacterized repeat protein (TIGR02543 family)